MRAYEVMVILEPGLEEDDIRATINRATELISTRGGRPGRVERWGKRRFAYEVNHGWEGIYILMEASGEPEVMSDLDRMLSLADEVIRHKVIRLPEAAARRARPAPAVAVEAGVAPSGSSAKET
ncbi:MAG: 30S ribosomal protein S6 [Acidimicrobiales bacterium]